MRQGLLMARLLRGAWRATPPPCTLSPEAVGALVPMLRQNGVASLAWWRSRRIAHPALASLRETHRFTLIQHLSHQHRLAQMLRLLREAGIEPVHYKGWSLATLYPDAGLRPYGDVDITVEPRHFERARDLLWASGNRDYCDLRLNFFDLPGRSHDALYARSRLAYIGGEPLRVLGHEDHLRLVCQHFRRHGGIRALWLCDAAMLLETRPPDFDWQYFLSGPWCDGEWAICILALAHLLLGARIEGTPVAAYARALPRWLVPTVLAMWEHPVSMEVPNMRRRPGESFWSVTRRRWFTPLQTAWRFQLPPASRLIRPLQAARFVGHTLPASRVLLRALPAPSRRRLSL